MKRLVAWLAVSVVLMACATSDLSVGSSMDAAVDASIGSCSSDQDAGAGVLWYPDDDGDGFGSATASPRASCVPLIGHTWIGTDCDDDDPTVHPGTTERCDGVDNDCRDGIDDGLFCGVCMCALAHAERVECVQGATLCTVQLCDTGFLNCDEDDANGCEASREDAASCGFCGNVCDARAQCVQGEGLFECVCEAGLMGDGVACADCEDGYFGTDGVCGPVLTGLALSSGTLTPTLSSDVNDYSTRVALYVETVALTPTASANATITINDEQVTSGQAWQTPTLNLGDNVFTIVVSEGAQPSRTYTLTIDRGAHELAYLKPAYNGSPSSFGSSLAIDGDTMVIGAVSEQGAASGVNGDPRLQGVASGAVYVFVRSRGEWMQQAYLKASNPGQYDSFGCSVAISRDTIVVGAGAEDSNAVGVDGDQSDNSARDAGAAYVFVRSGSTWSQQAYLKASNAGEADAFGAAVAIFGDTIAVGAPVEASRATGINGDQTDDTERLNGAVYVFVRTGNTWLQEAYVKSAYRPAYDQYRRPLFGSVVGLAADTLVVGDPTDASGSVGPNGDPTDQSAIQSGAVHVFARENGAWHQQAFIKASNPDRYDRFGSPVAISGDTLVVGAMGEDSRATDVDGDQHDNSQPDGGAVYVFTRSRGSWTQGAYLKGPNLRAASTTPPSYFFGSALAVDANTIVVGGYEGGHYTSDPYSGTWLATGVAYVFQQLAGRWTPRGELRAEQGEQTDAFGATVAVSGTTFAVGASGEASIAEGINGDQTNNDAPYSGAVYVFE